jgi:ADP-ribosyl-[dinitrogen reductase] hydrolase
MEAGWKHDERWYLCISMMKKTYKITDALLGFAVGDALGVPVEYKTREELAASPVTGMLEYMEHNQPAGTWSDDSSMVFCTLESLCNGYNLEDIATQFSVWMNRRFWTPRGRVFDIGIQTNKAIQRIDRLMEQGLRIKPIPETGVNERENGNGSLMRILPLAFFLANDPIEERFRVVREVSGLTHSHIRAVLGCFIYVEFAIGLLKELDNYSIYGELRQKLPEFLPTVADPAEIACYTRILDHNIAEFPEIAIQSSPYVVHSLEATLWCLMRGNNYKETVLQAVNLGEDADTIGALTGGLAGLYYGLDQIPAEWIGVLARKEDILDLAFRFEKALPKSS